MSANGISTIVQQALDERQLTLREMAELLGVSHPTIINWRDGSTVPTTDRLMQLVFTYDDWRREFAERILRLKLPELFK